MSVHYYPVNDINTETVLHIVHTDGVSMNIYESRTRDTVSLHTRAEIARVTPFRFESQGRKLLCFMFRDVNKQVLDITMPDLDVSDLIAALQKLQTEATE
jgi:hypothetical protein